MKIDITVGWGFLLIYYKILLDMVSIINRVKQKKSNMMNINLIALIKKYEIFIA